ANGDESGRMAAGPVQGSASRVLACGVRRAPVAYCRGLSARGTGEILYVRGLINAMLGVEAIRTAQEKFGKKPLTGEQGRWGLEKLNLPAERLSNLDSRTSCNRSRCHAPTTRARGRGVSRPGTAKNGTSCRRRFHYRAHGQGSRGKVRGREEDHGRLRDDQLTQCDAALVARSCRRNSFESEIREGANVKGD